MTLENSYSTCVQFLSHHRPKENSKSCDMIKNAIQTLIIPSKYIKKSSATIAPRIVLTSLVYKVFFNTNSC